jgi:hypothetical protein
MEVLALAYCVALLNAISRIGWAHCILPKKIREMLVVDEQRMVKYLSARAAHKTLGHGNSYSAPKPPF